MCGVVMWGLWWEEEQLVVLEPAHVGTCVCCREDSCLSDQHRPQLQ
jgi:hypothetical protein